MSDSEQGNGRPRLVWIDLLRVVSIFAVILLHCAAPLLLEFGDGGTPGWWIGNLYDSAVRWSVPVFVMVSGALLLGRAHRERLRDFLSRRFARVAIPFLAWSVLYFEWQIVFWDIDHRQLDLVGALLEGPISFHLWFVYMLLGLYLLAPLLSLVVDTAPRPLLVYAVALWVVWAGVLPLVGRIVGLDTWYSPERENSPLMLVGYFLLGALLRERTLDRRGRIGAAIVIVASFGITALSTYELTAAAGGEYQPLFYEYYSLNVVLMSIAVFLLAGNLPGLRSAPADSRRSRLWSGLAERVFGIYLVHVLVLDVLKEGTFGFTFDHATFHPAAAVPVLAVVVFAASLGIVLVVERIPGLRRVLL